MTKHADATMRAYLRARERHGALSAIQITTSGSRSECCRTSILRGTKGQVLCAKCLRPCAAEEWHEPRQNHHPSPKAEQSRIAAAADRWIPLRDAIEPTPIGLEADDWARCLLAWELYLHPRVSSRAHAAEIAREIAPKLGPWNEWRIRADVDYARVVVSIRLERTAEFDNLRQKL